MNYKKFIFLLLLASCTPKDLSNNYKKKIIFTDSFTNQGFALIYEENLRKKKIVSKSLDDRSLMVFQRNLKKNTVVKITNLDNKKSIIAKVGKDANYPIFFNVVISKRIFNELELNINEPYIQIKEINQNNSFIAKKAKTYDEEKKVADKAPVDEISIKSIDEDENIQNISKKIVKKDFNYIIKIGDFYFVNSAKLLKKRIFNELKINNVKIGKLSNTRFRVYLGPYKNLESLKKGFNDISNLEFENIEILKL